MTVWNFCFSWHLNSSCKALQVVIIFLICWCSGPTWRGPRRCCLEGGSVCLVPSADAVPELLVGLFRQLLVTSAELWSWQKDSLCGLERQRDRLLAPKTARPGLLACHPACLWVSLLNTARPMCVCPHVSSLPTSIPVCPNLPSLPFTPCILCSLH